MVSVTGAVVRLFPIALLSASVLLYQIAVTRLLSVVLWYHFAFLSISIAMLGLGALASGFRSSALPRLLPRVLVLAGVTIPLSIVVLVKARPFLLPLGEAAWLSAAMLAMLVPMTALGAACAAPHLGECRAVATCMPPISWARPRAPRWSCRA